MIRVSAGNQFVSPKFYGLLAIWPWLRISFEFFVCYLLFDHYCLTMTGELYVFLCKLNPIKAHWGAGSLPFSFERLPTFPPQADQVLVDLFLSVAARGNSVGRGPPTPQYITVVLTGISLIRVIEHLFMSFGHLYMFRKSVYSGPLHIFSLNHLFSCCWVVKVL